MPRKKLYRNYGLVAPPLFPRTRLARILGRMLARRLLAAVVALAAVASAAAVAVPTTTTTTWSAATTTAALGFAGSPSARTLFFSFYSNWQYNTTSSAFPPVANSNYNMLRACPAGLLCIGGPALTRAAAPSQRSSTPRVTPWFLTATASFSCRVLRRQCSATATGVLPRCCPSRRAPPSRCATPRTRAHSPHGALAHRSPRRATGRASTPACSGRMP